jgi:hypothetical protein
MRITEILVESQQVDEGPLLNKIGTAIGKGAGALAKGVGAVAGGIAGAGKAIKKGYQAGKDIVGQAGDEPAAAPAAGTAPASAATPAAGASAAPTQSSGPGLSGTTSATAAPAAAPTAAPAASAAPAANPSLYAQVKANVDKLDKKGKQRILNVLQKSLGVTAPAAAPTPKAAPAAPAAPATTMKKPVKVVGKKPAVKPAPQQQVASKINTGNLIAESFSFYRKK